MVLNSVCAQNLLSSKSSLVTSISLAMSHFVSRSGKDFDSLHHQLLSREPLDGQQEEEEQQDGSDDIAGESDQLDASQSSNERDSNHSISAALASRRRSSHSNRRQVSEDDHSPFTPSSSATTPSTSTNNRPSISSHSNSSSSIPQRPNSRSSGRDRKLSDPDSFKPQSYQLQVQEVDDITSSSALESHTNKLKARHGGTKSSSHRLGSSGKGVSFKDKKLGPGERDRPSNHRARSSHHGLIGVPRSNSGFDLENQIGDGNQSQGGGANGSGLLNGNGNLNPNHSNQSIPIRRSAGMISKSEMPPRKLGTWDGVFMPVSLNVSI